VRGDVALRITAEDIGPLLAALDMLAEEVDLNLEADYGIQVAADRIVWQQDMRNAAAALRDAEHQRRVKQPRPLMVDIRLPPPVASACHRACVVAANRLDHYSGIVSESAKGGVRPALASLVAHEPTLELVERYFRWVRDDAAWARNEALRLRLHAHEIMLHDSDNEPQ